MGQWSEKFYIAMAQVNKVVNKLLFVQPHIVVLSAQKKMVVYLSHNQKCMASGLNHQKIISL